MRELPPSSHICLNPSVASPIPDWHLKINVTIHSFLKNQLHWPMLWDQSQKKEARLQELQSFGSVMSIMHNFIVSLSVGNVRKEWGQSENPGTLQLKWRPDKCKMLVHTRINQRVFVLLTKASQDGALWTPTSCDSSATYRVICRPAAQAPPTTEELLRMQSLRPHLRPSESEYAS